MHAVITRKPGYMIDIDLYDEDGHLISGYGSVCYTMWGARILAKRELKRALRDQSPNESREVIRP